MNVAQCDSRVVASNDMLITVAIHGEENPEKLTADFETDFELFNKRDALLNNLIALIAFMKIYLLYVKSKHDYNTII